MLKGPPAGRRYWCLLHYWLLLLLLLLLDYSTLLYTIIHSYHLDDLLSRLLVLVPLLFLCLSTSAMRPFSMSFLSSASSICRVISRSLHIKLMHNSYFPAPFWIRKMSFRGTELLSTGINSALKNSNNNSVNWANNVYITRWVFSFSICVLCRSHLPGGSQHSLVTSLSKKNVLSCSGCRGLWPYFNASMPDCIADTKLWSWLSFILKCQHAVICYESK